MKTSKFTEGQIAFVLKQVEDGTPVAEVCRKAGIAEVCRKAGIAEATFYNWRKRYAGLMPSEVKRLRQLEEENGKLKRHHRPHQRIDEFLAAAGLRKGHEGRFYS